MTVPPDPAVEGARQRAPLLLSLALTALRGAALGVVELVPGVSAGTLALVLGIYERMVGAVSALVDLARALLGLAPHVPGAPRAGWRAALGAAWRRVPWAFVVPLLAGMQAAILSASHLVGAILDRFPGHTLGFFAGVVLVSVALPLSAIGRWRWHHVLALATALIAALVVLGLPTSAATDTPRLWYLALSGATASAVMVLPGVSGAMVLLILGPYPYVVDLVRGLTSGNVQLLPLLIFSGGTLVGVALISKALAWLFAHAHGVTLAALSGLMLGSLRRLWPFLAYEVPATGEPPPLHAVPKLPLSELATVPAPLLTGIALAAAAGGLVAAAGVWAAVRSRRRAAAAGAAAAGDDLPRREGIE